MRGRPSGHDDSELKVVELFKLMNPVPRADEEATTSPGAERLLQDILSGDHPTPRLRPSRRLQRQRRILPFAMVVVGLSTAAFAWAMTRQASDPLQVGCYAEVDLGGDIVVLETDERGFVGVCTQAWERGDLGESVEVPDLAACVLDSGAVGVFPRDEVEPCGSLGLSGLAEEPAPDEQELVGLDDAVTEMFLARGCVEPGEGRQIVTSALAERGLKDWSVLDAGPYSDERPCASVSIDPTAKTVTLVPIPPKPER